MCKWLEAWKEASVESAKLSYQATVKTIEAEYALAMHKSVQFGKAAPAPAPAASGGQAAMQGGGGAKIVCADCGTEIKDSPGKNGGDPYTAQKKAKKSIDDHGRILCFNCSKNQG